MLLLAALIVATQAAAASPQQPTPSDSTRADSTRRIPVTAEHLATAFRDATARDLLQRARVTRLRHDSAISSYDSRVRSRMTFGMSIGRIGRERILYRQESAARVQWQRDVGVHIEMTGMRAASPVTGQEVGDGIDDVHSMARSSEVSPIPYFPGSETLWIGVGAARAEVDERNLINPMAEGSEAYYTFATGDSVSFRLPQGRVIRLRELTVRPREPRWNVTVGSLWFDVETAQLVRAAFRLAAPLKMQVGIDDDASLGDRAFAYIMRGVISPATAHVTGVAVEYGLYQGRFWLPRQQSVEGYADVSLARVGMAMEHTFAYDDVNGDLQLAAIMVDTTNASRFEIVPPPDSLDAEGRRRWRDSTRAVYRVARQAVEDSALQGLRTGDMRQCDTSSTVVITRYRHRSRIPVSLRMPCTKEALIESADFTTSIFDDSESVIGSSEQEELLDAALGMAAQSGFGFVGGPRIQLGPTMMRYNRVEGFSPAARADQQLGGGFTTDITVRYGTADHVLSGEWGVSRSNARRTTRLGAYSRLAVANDWGDPLSFRSSLAAILFGRDEGFYYRARGAELRWASERGLHLDWRAFMERQRDAPQRSTFSVTGDLPANVASSAVDQYGAAVTHVAQLGVDPLRSRLFSTMRLEGASGDSTYARGSLELTLSDQLVRGLSGALTLAGGSSVGGVPPQRRWFLGGSRTIRGQDADTAQSGTAFWMTRVEFGTAFTGARPTLFADLGWVGDRSRVAEVGRPLSGVGIGASFLDGLIRFDVARGLHPRKQTRVLFYFDAPF